MTNSTPNPASPQRPIPYKSLDFWRGVASLWVVMYHSTVATSDVHPELQSSVWFFLSHRGGFGVWMFFVLSGYCIASAGVQAMQRGDGLGSFLRARFRRIYPAFWCSAILYFCFSATASWLVKTGHLGTSTLAKQNVLHQAPLYYLANLTLLQRPLKQQFLQGVYWTLGYEIAFYLIVGLGLWLTLRWSQNRGRVMLNLLHMVTVVSLLMLLVAKRVSFYPFDLWPHFGLGVLIYDLIWNPQEKGSKILLTLSTGEILWFFCLNHAPSNDHLDVKGGLSFVFSLGFALALLVLHRHDERLIKIRGVGCVAWVGMFSYSLYLTHYVIVTMLSKLAEMKGIEVTWFALSRIVIIICSIVFARLFFQLCEKPFMGKKRQVIAASSQHPGQAVTVQ